MSLAHRLPLARGRYTNLSKMSPMERGTTLDKFLSEYTVYGDFECKAPYTPARHISLLGAALQADQGSSAPCLQGGAPL